MTTSVVLMNNDTVPIVIPASQAPAATTPADMDIIINTPIDAELFAQELAEHISEIRRLEIYPENRVMVGEHRIMASMIVEALAGFLLTSDTFA